MLRHVFRMNFITLKDSAGWMNRTGALGRAGEIAAHSDVLLYLGLPEV